MEERKELSRVSEAQGLRILDAQQQNAKLLEQCASVQDSAVEWMGQMDRCRYDNEQRHQQILHLEAKSMALSTKTSAANKHSFPSLHTFAVLQGPTLIRSSLEGS